jgi:hypothetical protein
MIDTQCFWECLCKACSIDGKPDVFDGLTLTDEPIPMCRVTKKCLAEAIREYDRSDMATMLRVLPPQNDSVVRACIEREKKGPLDEMRPH